MGPRDLRAFLAELERRGELVRITERCDPHLEIAAFADRVSRALAGANKALLFESVRGSRLPVLINALGSRERMLLACGLERDDALEGKIGDFLALLEKPRPGLVEKLRALPLLGRLGRLFPRMVRRAPCQAVVLRGEEIDLDLLPILTTWPLDGGPYITLPLVFTRDPVSGARNCGMYRLQRYDKRTTGFHVHTHHTGAEHLRRAGSLGRDRLEVAVAIGADPAVIFSAVAPLPPGVDEMLFAGFLRGAPVDLVRCKSVDLEVPAGAEIVLEGYVLVDELRREGPFGDHTGFYSLADDYPVLHLTAMTMRRDPIYAATVVGPPPQEDCHMAWAVERLFLPLLRKQLPEVLDYHMPFEGVFHNLMLVRIRKEYPGQARKIMHAVWGLGQAMFTKVVVVVDEDGPELSEYSRLGELLARRLDPRAGIELVAGPVETLDHASRALHFGGKMGIDLTRPFAGEGREGVPSVDGGPAREEIERRLCALSGAIEDCWLIDAGGSGAELAVLSLDKEREGDVHALIRRAWALELGAASDRVIVFDARDRVRSIARALWLGLGAIDPGRDVAFDESFATSPSGRRELCRHPRRIGIDATRKSPREGFERGWPEEQLHPPEVLERVRALWARAGLAGTMPEPER